jgi:uncharacterized protein (TIGR02246 family)
LTISNPRSIINGSKQALQARKLTMTAQPSGEIESLYRNVLESWNNRSAQAMAALFAEDANVVGFDGSPINGRAEIEAAMRGIFADHPTASYVSKVREIRFLTPDVAVLRAVVGMIPPGKSDVNPAVNAIQTLVAVKQNGQWHVAVYQNTPAAFHGRPEMSAALTEELRALL